MSEPRRWLDDASVAPRLRDLLDAAGPGSSAVPSAVLAGAELPAAVRDRVAGRLSVTLGITMVGAGVATTVTSSAGAATVGGAAAIISKGAAGTTIASASAVSLKSLVLASTLSIAIGGTAVVGASMLGVVAPSVSVPSPAAQRATASVSAVETRLRSVSLRAPVVTPPPLAAANMGAPATAPAPEPSVGASSQRPAMTMSTPIPMSREFAEEASSLREVSGLLPGSPALALTRLDEHAVRYPKSQLGAERNVVKMRALLLLGRRAEATAIGAQLLSSKSATLYHDRVRILLGHEKQDALKQDEQ